MDQQLSKMMKKASKIVDYYDKLGFEIVVGENGKGNIYYTIKKEQKK